jgi:hypothetical protein
MDGTAFQTRVSQVGKEYNLQEKAKREAEREKNEDIEGFQKRSLFDYGFRLRTKYENNPLAKCIYKATDIYESQDEKRKKLLIDC